MTLPPGIGVHPMKWAEVNLAALRRNAGTFRRAMGEGVEVMAMVKAGAYGHGGPPAARALLTGGATWLGVALPGEALELRQAGIDAPILVVGWSHPDTHEALIRAGVDVTLADAAGADAVLAAARRAGQPARVHLKTETGMNRQGLPADEVPAVLARIAAEPRWLRLAGVFTHFADADGADPGPTERQHERFLPLAAAAREIEPDVAVHCANSAAALRFAHTRHGLVRPGIALYGYLPPHCPPLDVEPAMTVRALVTQVKTVRAGESVGYGRTWTATADTRVATVAAGYADGLHRAQSNRGNLLVHGVRCPILGRVSMDQVSIDVSVAGDVTAGQSVIIVGGSGGDRLGADEVAAVEHTISYEVLCAVSARVPRHFVEDREGT